MKDLRDYAKLFNEALGEEVSYSVDTLEQLISRETFFIPEVGIFGVAKEWAEKLVQQASYPGMPGVKALVEMYVGEDGYEFVLDYDNEDFTKRVVLSAILKEVRKVRKTYA